MKAIQFPIWLMGLTGAAWALNWLDAWHALYGVLLLAGLTAAVLAVKKSQRRHRKKTLRAKEPPLFSHVVYGLVKSGLTACVLWAGFAVLSLVGAPDPFEDAGRVEFELRLGERERQRDFDGAIRLIEQQTARIRSEDWKAELRLRLFKNLLAAGRAAEPERATVYLKRAVDQAVTEHESLLANLLLERIAQHRLLQNAKARYHEAGRWSDLADLLNAVLVMQLESRWDGDVRQELFDALVQQGRTATSLEGARSAFREAITVAQEFNLDSRSAAAPEKEIDVLHELESRREWRDLIALLKQRIERFPASQSVGMLCSALLGHGSAQEKLEDKLALYEEAVNLAQKHNFKSDDATERRNKALVEMKKRASVLKTVETLRSQEKYPELISFLQQEITARPKGHWHFPLADWLLDAYCRFADVSDLQVRIEVCRKALQFAKEHDLEATDVRSRLLAAERERQRQIFFLAKLKELRLHRRYTELLSVLKVHAEAPREEWLCSADTAMYQIWLEWGDAASDLANKLSRYQQAQKTAKQYSLDSKEADAKCRRVQAEIHRLEQIAAERNRPRDLPPGTTAKLLRISTEPYPPSLLTVIQVLDKEHEPIKLLERKDFRVELNGKAVSAVELAPIERERIPLSLLICLDTSRSTQNSLAFAIAGTKQLVERLKLSNDHVKIVSFNSKTESVCEWTSNKEMLRQRLASLNSGGETALFNTITGGANELSKRSGERCLVVFTDGRNTHGDATLKDTLAACKRANVRVHAIGLRTKDLDRSSLLALTKATGGRYVEAVSTRHLAGLFADTSGRVRQHYYRLILTPAPSVGPIEKGAIMSVSVGGKNSVQAAGEIHPR